MRPRAVVLVSLGFLLAGCAPTDPNAAVGHERRVEVVEMIRSGQLTERDEFGRVLLPDGYTHLSIWGLVDVRDEPLMVFFLTWTGFGPDPYCGYEYSEDPEAVLADPIGSGAGEVRALKADGWYWICAR